MATITTIKAGVGDYSPTAPNSGRNVATDSTGRIWVAYGDTIGSYIQVIVAYSDDGGQTWAGYEQINQVTTRDQRRPSIAVDSNDNIHVMWQDYYYYPYAYYICHSVRVGGVWQAYTNVDSSNASWSTIDIVAGASGVMHALWGKNVSGTGEYVQYASWNGSWSAITTLDTTATSEFYDFALALDSGGELHVLVGIRTRMGGTPDGLYYYHTSGGSWQAREDWVSNSVWVNAVPSLVAGSGGVVHAAWVDKESSVSTTHYVRYRLYSGGSWGSIVTVDTLNLSFSPAGLSIQLTASSEPSIVASVYGYGNDTSDFNIEYWLCSGAAWGSMQHITDEANWDDYPSGDAAHDYFAYGHYDEITGIEDVMFCNMEMVAPRRRAYAYSL